MSWNTKIAQNELAKESQSPCGAVSWNALGVPRSICILGQSPCGAVSWNVSKLKVVQDQSPSVPLRGCELKCGYRSAMGREQVSPLAGLWVEIHGCGSQRSYKTSQSPCGAVSWNSVFSNQNQFVFGQSPCGKIFFTWQFPCFSCMIEIVWRDIYRFHANVCNDHSRRTDYGS